MHDGIQEIPEASTPPTSWFSFGGTEAHNTPGKRNRLGFTGVMIEAFNIIQDKIVRARMSGDPPDFSIRPKVAKIGLSEFHRADEAIQLGYEAAIAKLETLEENGLREALEKLQRMSDHA